MKSFKPFHAIAILSFLVFGCSKSKNNPTPTPVSSNVKITLVSGNNQTAAKGNAVSDSIAVLVTNNGQPLNNCAVQFTGSGCNSDLTAELQTKADGTIKYSWRLAANQGSQTLNIVAVNGGVRADSISVSANAVSPSAAQQISACTPYNLQTENICQLTTGRLIACFRGQASLRYSDDNGVSWNPIKGFGNKHNVYCIVTTAQDEIFAGTYGDGIFYSKDLGVTWTDITPSTFNKADGPTDMSYSAKGSFMFTGHTNQIFITYDKGKTWAGTNNGLQANVGYLSPTELNNGDLYVLSLPNILYKSTDKGATWVAQNDYSAYYVSAINIDDKGRFYKSTFPTTHTGTEYSTIYISIDNGQSFSTLYTVNDQTWNISLQPNGHFYYSNFFTLNVMSSSNSSSVAVNKIEPAYSRFYIMNTTNFIYVGLGGQMWY